MKHEFKLDHLNMQNLANYYRKIQEIYGKEVAVEYVDPRNLLSIAYYFLKHWLKKQIPFSQFLKSLYNIRHNAIFYNGFMLNPTKEKENIEAILDEIMKRRTDDYEEMGDKRFN